MEKAFECLTGWSSALLIFARKYRELADQNSRAVSPVCRDYSVAERAQISDQQFERRFGLKCLTGEVSLTYK
jgi:hypothetical protein